MASDAAKAAQDAVDRAAAEKTAAAKAVADKAAADKAIADKAAADATAAAERAAAEHAAAVKAIEDKAIADRVAAEKVAADKAVSDKAAFEKADAERPVAAEKPPVYEGRLGETITVSAERERPRGYGALTQDYQFGSKMPMEPIKEPGTTEVPKKTGILGDALTLATLIPGMVGTGGQQVIPLPQGGLTASGTPGPGSSALAQVLNQGGAGAPVFGTNQDKGKKSKWNLESLRYMGNQDKGE